MDWTFWIGTVVFLATYILIATEKVHKVICALAGAALMFIFVLARITGTMHRRWMPGPTMSILTLFLRFAA